METITYNGVDLTAPLDSTKPKLVVTEVNRPLVSFESTATKVDGADGEYFDMLQVGVRECSFALVATKLTQRERQLMARKLAGVLAVRNPRRLCFSDERDTSGNQLARLAVPDGVFDAEEFIRAGKWTMRFKQHDPYLYGKSRSVVLKTNQPQKVQTGGNAEAWPLASANPDGSTYTLGIQNGKGIVIKASFAGKSLFIDFAKERVSIKPNATGAAGIQTNSRFFPLQGTMTLVASAQTTLTWTERWL